MKESRKVYGWLVRDGNAAVGCSSMWADTMKGECYCGNLLWHSSLTFYPYVLETSNTKIDAIRKLSSRSSALEIHRAVSQFSDNVSHAMNASGAEAETAGAPEKQACRNFIAAIMVSRCGANTLRAMQGAFVGDKPAKILAVYESIVNSKQNEGIEPRLIVPFDGEFNGDEINAAEILEDILNLASR